MISVITREDYPNWKKSHISRSANIIILLIPLNYKSMWLCFHPIRTFSSGRQPQGFGLITHFENKLLTCYWGSCWNWTPNSRKCFDSPAWYFQPDILGGLSQTQWLPMWGRSSSITLKMKIVYLRVQLAWSQWHLDFMWKSSSYHFVENFIAHSCHLKQNCWFNMVFNSQFPLDGPPLLIVKLI